MYTSLFFLGLSMLSAIAGVAFLFTCGGTYLAYAGLLLILLAAASFIGACEEIEGEEASND